MLQRHKCQLEGASTGQISDNLNAKIMKDTIEIIGIHESMWIINVLVNEGLNGGGEGS